MILSSARCSIHGSAQFGAGLLLCSRDNRRKELFMNAKDKEKLNMAGTIVSLLKGDTIVIDPDEFRRRADIKNKEFYEVEKDTGCKEEKKVPRLTDAEMLCCDIAIHIAHKTAARFEDMADGMEMSTLKQIVRRIEEAEPETIAPMLQTMFLARGMVDAAKDLDILELCFRYDEDTYYLSYDILFDTDIFDWLSIENMFDDFHNEDERKTD